MYEGNFCARQMIPGAAAGNCPLKHEIHVLGESGHLGREGEKDLLTGEAFALVVALRKGLLPMTKIPRQRILSRVICTFHYPALPILILIFMAPSEGCPAGNLRNARGNAEFRRKSWFWCCHRHL